MRRLVRLTITVALACCLLLDVALAEGAISGCCDVGYFDANGRLVFPGPEPALWLPIAGFVILQGILVFVLIRLRRSRPDHTPIA